MAESTRERILDAALRAFGSEGFAATSLDALATELGIQGETLQALKVFDMCIRNLFKQADEAGDYLRMIVRNFDGMLDQPEGKHLKVFYLIVPPLTLSQIEHIQKGNERIMSKNKNVGGFISDDGFSLGVSYLLKILKQSDKFAGLNWFDSIMGKLKKDNEREMNEPMDKYGDRITDMAYEDQKLDIEMSKRRIQKLTREYEMLNFSFSASSILFKEI